MSVWFCAPSKRPEAEATPLFAKWIERGYNVAIQLDSDTPEPKWYVRAEVQAAITPASTAWRTMLEVRRPYVGYAEAQNFLIKAIMERDSQADWFVCAADDIEPDPKHMAQQIARECGDYFRNLHIEATGETFNVHPTFGVMQCTADRWGDNQGAYIDRVAGSPWIGKEFARRAYGGNGPYWPEYTHMGVDEELREVAIKLGVYWERPDLMHFHRHWGRPQPGEQWGQRDRMPAFLAEANSPEHWARYKRIFNDRKAHGFPGHEVKS